jgi:hypothetical protein
MLMASAFAVGVAITVNAGGPPGMLIRRVVVFAAITIACVALLVWSMRATYFGPGPGRRSDQGAIPVGGKPSLIARLKT